MPNVRYFRLLIFCHIFVNLWTLCGRHHMLVFPNLRNKNAKDITKTAKLILDAFVMRYMTDAKWHHMFTISNRQPTEVQLKNKLTRDETRTWNAIYEILADKYVQRAWHSSTRRWFFLKPYSGRCINSSRVASSQWFLNFTDMVIRDRDRLFFQLNWIGKICFRQDDMLKAAVGVGRPHYNATYKLNWKG